MQLNNRAIREHVRMERFEDIYGRFTSKELSCEGAADLLGCSVRHFHRLRDRFEENGLGGLRDGRVGSVAPNRAADEETEMITKLYNDRYKDFSVRHFYEFLVLKHSVKRSYGWTKNVLTRKRLITPSKRGGPHRLRRERSPMRGMMIHQDGSTHQWVPGKMWDLIVTMDDATSEIYSAFFVEEEGTDSSFRGIREVIENEGLFCSFYSDRGSHYFTTPEAGGKVDKTNLTQVGRALKQLNIKHIAAYSPQARGRSESHRWHDRWGPILSSPWLVLLRLLLRKDQWLQPTLRLFRVSGQLRKGALLDVFSSGVFFHFPYAQQGLLPIMPLNFGFECFILPHGLSWKFFLLWFSVQSGQNHTFSL